MTVPGAVRLWEDAAREHGRLPLADLLAPARELAEARLRGRRRVARLGRGRARRACGRARPPATASCRAGRAAGGRARAAPDLARTLGGDRRGGRDALYEGEIAERIVDAVRADGGFLTPDDLPRTARRWVEPIATDYRGLRVHEMPPPTTGVAALMILDALARMTSARWARSAPSASTWRWRRRSARTRSCSRTSASRRSWSDVR